jgi:hypothetical protein
MFVANRLLASATIRAMRTFTKIAVRTVLVLIAVLVLLVIVARSFFFVAPMRNNTMWPLIASNNIVVADKWFDVASLRTGDLVVVQVPTPAGPVFTVRKIEQQMNTPTGQFYLRAVNTNGLDSRWFGTLPARDIKARVVWIIK